jgi:hypothetical protein
MSLYTIHGEPQRSIVVMASESDDMLILHDQFYLSERGIKVLQSKYFIIFFDCSSFKFCVHCVMKK